MAMIQGLDASLLINAMQAGRKDRMVYDNFQAKREEMARKAREDQEYSSLLSQALPRDNGAPRGIAEMYGQPKPQSFDQAFSPQVMETFAGGGNPAPAVEASAVPAPTARGQMRFDPAVLGRMMQLRPEQTKQMLDGLKAASDVELKQIETRNTALGAAANYLAKFPPQERQQRLATVLPFLVEAGWSAEQVAGQPLDDRSLGYYQTQAMGLDTAIDNELQEREFQAGKSVAVAPGGNVAIVRPDGSARWAIGGGDTPSSAPVDIPQGAQDYLRQHPELRGQFDQKYGAGAADRVLGGGASNGTGNFPPRP